jgi:hypothetical protein
VSILTDEIRSLVTSFAPFAQGLRDLGYVEGRGVAFEHRLTISMLSGGTFATQRQLSRRSAISHPAILTEVVDLNLTANWRLIRAMYPLLRTG